MSQRTAAAVQTSSVHVDLQAYMPCQVLTLAAYQMFAADVRSCSAAYAAVHMSTASKELANHVMHCPAQDLYAWDRICTPGMLLVDEHMLGTHDNA